MFSFRGSSQPKHQTQVSGIRWRLYHLSHQGSLTILEWPAYPFSRGSYWPRNRTGISCIAGVYYFLTTVLPGKHLHLYPRAKYHRRPCLSPATHSHPSPGPKEESVRAERLEILVSWLEFVVSCFADVPSLSLSLSLSFFCLVILKSVFTTFVDVPWFKKIWVLLKFLLNNS